MQKNKLEEAEYTRLLKEYKENIAESSAYVFSGLKTIAYCFKVVDGDTIKCLIKVPLVHTADTKNTVDTSFLKVIVRLDGVDTAEKKSINEQERKLAERASAFTKKILEDKLVHLHFINTDKYGRHLCNVYQVANCSTNNNIVGGDSVSQQLIDNKLANCYEGKKKETFVNLIQ